MIRLFIAATIVFSLVTSKAFSQPSLPTSCLTNTGNGAKSQDDGNRMVVTSTGTNTFMINSLGLFEGPAPSAVDNISATVNSRGSRYRLYVAGQIDYVTGGTTTNIPLNTFSVSARRSSGSSTGLSVQPVVLSGSYQPIIETLSETTNNAPDIYQFTLDRAKIDTFKQAPGNYQLTVFFCYCWY